LPTPPLLLDGLSVGGKTVPDPERLVQLYDASGKPEEAARWRKELKARTANDKGL
jgi:hypothetical protein